MIFFIKNNYVKTLFASMCIIMLASNSYASSKLPKIKSCSAANYISYKWNKNTALTEDTPFIAYKKFICKSAYEGFLVITQDQSSGFLYQIIGHRKQILSKADKNGCKLVANFCHR